MIRYLLSELARLEETSIGDVGGTLLIFVILFIATGWVSVLQVSP